MRIVLILTAAMIVGAVGLLTMHSAMAKEPDYACLKRKVVVGGAGGKTPKPLPATMVKLARATPCLREGKDEVS